MIFKTILFLGVMTIVYNLFSDIKKCMTISSIQIVKLLKSNAIVLCRTV